MTKRTKRLLSMLLVLVMMIGMLPISVAAATPIVTVYRNPKVDIAAEGFSTDDIEAALNGFSVRDEVRQKWENQIIAAANVGGNDVRFHVQTGGLGYCSLVDARWIFLVPLQCGYWFGWTAAREERNYEGTESRVQIFDGETALTGDLTVKIKGYVNVNWNIEISGIPDITADAVSGNVSIPEKIVLNNALGIDARTTAAEAYANTLTANTQNNITYSFAGWDITGDGNVDNVDAYTGTIDVIGSLPAENVDGKTFTAIYEVIDRKGYNINWDSANDAEDVTKVEDYGKMPATVPTGATKASDEQYNYTFAQWSPEVAVVTGDKTYTATYTQAERYYTVQWLNDDGSVLETDADQLYSANHTYDGDEPVSVNDGKGYTLIDWIKAVDSENGVITYTAKYSDNKTKYTVSFDVNGGNETINAVEIYYGATVPVKDVVTPTKEEHVFKNWIIQGTNEEFVLGETLVTDNITLVAQWTKVHKVTFNSNGGTAVETAEVLDGKTVSAPATSQEGYKFVQWNDASGNKFNFTTKITGDITLTAQWVKVHTVTFKNGTYTKSVEVDDGQQVAASQVPTFSKEGYDFAYWKLEDGDGTEFDLATEITGDITLIPEWTEKVAVATTLEITGENEISIVYGEEFTADTLKAIAIPVVKDADGNVLENASVNVSKLPTEVGVHEVTLSYAGKEYEYKYSSATVTLTIEKATASVVVSSYSLKYGQTIGEVFKTNCDTIDFIAGLDAHDETYLVGAVQVTMPDEMLQLLALGASRLGINLNDLTIDEVKTLVGMADQLGNDQVSEAVALLKQYEDSINKLIAALEEIQAELPMGTELKISVVNTLTMPTNIGVYVTGSVACDANYTSDMDAGYIIILPNGIKADLAWNNNDDNYIITTSKMEGYDFGATATVDESTVEGATKPGDVADHLEYLFVGVDNDGELLLNRVRTTEDVNAILTQVGAYAQVAYIANWDNVMYYAEPIVRPIVVAPNVADVAILDGNGNENYAQVYTYGETVKASVTVDGQAAPVDGLKVKYIGSDTTADGWYRDEAPTDAGVYTIVAVYTETDAQGDISKAGGAVGAIIIEPADTEVGLKDTTVCPDGDQHFAELTNEALDYVTIAIDRENNVAYINLPEDASAHAERIITMLPASVEKEVVALLDKYADFDGDVEAATVKAELNAVLDKVIAADLTAESKAAAEKAINKLSAEIENSEDVQALIAKIESEVAALEEALRNEVPDELETKLEDYIRDVVTVDGTNVDVDVDKVKADVNAMIAKLEGKLPASVVAELKEMADELVAAVEAKVDVETIEEKATAIVEKLENLSIEDAETLVKAMIGAAAGQIDTEQLKALATAVIGKVEALGYVDYITGLLKDIAGMYEGNIDVDSYVAAVESELNALIDTAKAKVESGDLSADDLEDIEAYVDSVLTKLKTLVDKLPEGTFIFGQNPSEEGTYDCYAMNISANYKPEFVSATLTIGHTPGEAVKENVVDATCTAEGKHDEVIYCEVCEKELERTEDVVDPKIDHTPGDEVIENKVEPTLFAEGGYDKVVYCSVCNTELSREHVVIPMLDGYTVYFPAEEANGVTAGGIVYIDGVPTELDDNYSTKVATTDIMLAITYDYNMDSASSKYPDHYFDVYPTEMYVWELVFVESEDGDYFKAVRIEGMDNVLQYAGASVRINGLADTNGIRMITGVPTKAKQAMIDGSMFDGTILEGYKLEEYGTIAAWEVSNVDLTLNTQGTGHAAAYKKGSMDKVFQNDGSRILYANTLTPLRDMYITKDLLVRPYLTLSNGDELVTLYGGTVQRSIGYVAYQNRATYQNGTEYYNYVWDIIEKAGGVAAFE